MAVAAAGIASIALTALDGAHDLTFFGLGCVLAAATSWAAGNVLVRRSGKADMLAFVTWLSLVPPLPLFGLSIALEGPARVLASLAHPTWLGVAAVLFIGLAATNGGFAGGGHLIKLYGVLSRFSCRFSARFRAGFCSAKPTARSGSAGWRSSSPGSRSCCRTRRAGAAKPCPPAKADAINQYKSIKTLRRRI
jgi:hypothetical protein